MRLTIISFLTVLAAAAPAAAQDVRIKNDGDTTIYRLYAWASDLTPSTENLLAFPLSPGEVKTVSIDNEWSDCKFTFLIDINSPEDIKRKNYIHKDMFVNSASICHQRGKPVLLKQDDRPDL